MTVSTTHTALATTASVRLALSKGAKVSLVRSNLIGVALRFLMVFKVFKVS